MIPRNRPRHLQREPPPLSPASPSLRLFYLALRWHRSAACPDSSMSEDDDWSRPCTSDSNRDTNGENDADSGGTERGHVGPDANTIVLRRKRRKSRMGPGRHYTGALLADDSDGDVIESTNCHQCKRLFGRDHGSCGTASLRPTSLLIESNSLFLWPHLCSLFLSLCCHPIA
jgi:hypothetical protein